MKKRPSADAPHRFSVVHPLSLITNDEAIRWQLFALLNQLAGVPAFKGMQGRLYFLSNRLLIQSLPVGIADEHQAFADEGVAGRAEILMPRGTPVSDLTTNEARALM